MLSGKPFAAAVCCRRYWRHNLGVKIPPTNLQDYHLEAARRFAGRLADRLLSGSMSAA